MSANLYIGESGSIVCYNHAGSTLQHAITNARPNAMKFLGMNDEVFEFINDTLRDYLRFMYNAHVDATITEINCEVCGVN